MEKLSHTKRDTSKEVPPVLENIVVMPFTYLHSIIFRANFLPKVQSPKKICIIPI